MKINTKILGWIFLGLYVAIIIGLFGIVSGSLFEFIFPWRFILPIPSYDKPLLLDKPFWTLFILIITLVSQALFIFGAGTINLHRPVGRVRLIIPVIIASLMMAVLVVAFINAVCDLMEWRKFDFVKGCDFLVALGSIWIAWVIIFFIRYRNAERYRVLRNLFSTIIAGSLIELLITIPIYHIVKRRPYCFAGFRTQISIADGLVVMLWAFGPGIIFLFLHEKHKAELQRAKKIQRNEKA